MHEPLSLVDELYKCVAKPNRPNLSNATTLGSDLDLNVVLFSVNRKNTSVHTIAGKVFSLKQQNTTRHATTQHNPYPLNLTVTPVQFISRGNTI